MHQSPLRSPPLSSIVRSQPVNLTGYRSLQPHPHSSYCNIDVHTPCCVHRLCLNCGETKLENLTASTCHLSVVKIERGRYVWYVYARERERERGLRRNWINKFAPRMPLFHLQLFNRRSNHVLIQSSNPAVGTRFSTKLFIRSLYPRIRPSNGALGWYARRSIFQFFFSDRRFEGISRIVLFSRERGKYPFFFDSKHRRFRSSFNIGTIF